MTATLSSRGQIVIPQEIRTRCGLREGDHFVVEDNPDTQVVTLRKIKPARNWVDVLLECPEPFEIPPRRREFYTKDGLVS
jgi:AbrB family looped-hinge helix DNA binding protein